MMVRRSEMKAHPGKQVGCPQKQWMMEARSTVLLLVGRNYFHRNLYYNVVVDLVFVGVSRSWP